MAEKKPKKEAVKKSGKDSDEQKELQAKYTKLFKNVVSAIKEEENMGIVYQVLVDIVVQLEQQIRSQKGGCSGCGHSCDECGHE